MQMFDRNRLRIQSLGARRHDLDLSVIKELDNAIPEDALHHAGLRTVAERVIRARSRRASVIVIIGAHVLRSGVQKYLIDLMKNGYVSCVAMNGAGMIHDFEFALIGATTESVAHYLRQGRFGLWKETGAINDIINKRYKADPKAGMGAVIGQHIATGAFPYKDISILAAGFRFQVPMTVHVGIGFDIIHELPNCDGAATGALSYNDFLTFTAMVQNLENGVLMSFGSAVTGPEVFLKALSMARNVAGQQGQSIAHFSSLVCDLHDLPEEIHQEAPKENPLYYFRPWKTLLVRTVAEGGEGLYVKGRHEKTIPGLWKAIVEEDARFGKDRQR